MSASVKKIVHPTGKATAIRFFSRPRVTNLIPMSFHSFLVVSRRPKCVLNCSFRITSSGFVNAAPATPAAMLLYAERSSRSVSYWCPISEKGKRGRKENNEKRFDQ